MARIRNIKPEFFMSEDMGSLTVISRLLFIALWCHADREGKMKYQRTALAAQCLPYEMDQFDDALRGLIDNGNVIMYEVNNKKYLYLPTFTEHQRPHNTERESQIPDFNGDLTVKEPLKERESPTGKGKGKGRGSVHKVFTPPTLDEVRDYCQSRKNNVDPARWHNFYSAKGWLIGKNKMKDWKAAVRTWENQEPQNYGKGAI